MQENNQEIPLGPFHHDYNYPRESQNETGDIVRKFRRSFNVLTVSQQILNLALFVLHGNLVRRLWHHARDCQSAACQGDKHYSLRTTMRD